VELSVTATHFVFIDTHEFDNGQAVRGAALVTDSATEPVEFRCTSPIRPTLLQKTLWGKRLLGHVACQLVGKPLLDALSNPVALIVVRKPEFVGLRELVGQPLVQLLRNEELTMASSLTSSEPDDGVLESGAGQFEPLVLKVHRNHPDDFKCARDLLAETFRSHNPREPFDRIKNALDLIHQQDAAKSGR
jgi:hypothetical protein